MSKRIGHFETRKKALDFAKDNKIPIKQVKEGRIGETPIFRLIVADAVYKRWIYSQRKKCND